jgi:hypothetical protein
MIIMQLVDCNEFKILQESWGAMLAIESPSEGGQLTCATVLREVR